MAFHKSLKLIFASILIFSSIHFVAPHVLAESIKKQIQDVKEKQADLIDKRSDLKDEISQKQSEIANVKTEQGNLEAEIKKLDIQVSETQNSIRETEAAKKKTEEEIVTLEKEIEELKVRIAKRDEILKERVRSVQQSGGVISYLDVLLGAKSFGDFLDRVSSVTIIVQQDKEILQTHVEEKELVEKKKDEVTALLAKQEQQLADLERLEANLEDQRKQKDQLMAQLKEKEHQIEEELLEVQEQDEILSKQQTAMKKLVQQLQEKERRRQEAIKKGETPPVTDGSFMRPAFGPISSNYGARWGKLHAGIDIAKRGNNVPVVAAADGVVIRSYYSSSYGNAVFVTHNIDGQVYTTIYAHLENREVSDGDTVTKGQRLGYMGNTGRSFGAHLHFELHKGPWNVNKSNSIDPRKLIDF